MKPTGQELFNLKFKKACKHEDLETVKKLISKVDQKTKQTGLSTAVLWNKTSIIRFLLEEGKANPNDKHAILLKMAEYGNKEMIQLYFEKGGNPFFTNNLNWNALHFAAYHGRFETVKYLVSIGFDYKHLDKDGRTALSLVETSQFWSGFGVTPFQKENGVPTEIDQKLLVVQFLKDVKNEPTTSLKVFSGESANTITISKELEIENKKENNNSKFSSAERSSENNFETLEHLSDSDLLNLGMSLGFRKKLVIAIKSMS